MGLLSRVSESRRTVQKTEKPVLSETRVTKKKNQIEAFLSEADSLGTGFDFSERLFGILFTFLNLNKAALLLLNNDNDTFFPIAVNNLDTTTARHLRIERSVLEQKFLDYNEIISSDDDRLRIFKQYLSIREFSALNKLMLVPFYTGGILNSVLLVFEPDSDTLDLSREISLNSEKITRKLIKSRIPFNPVTKKQEELPSGDPVHTLQNFIDNNSAADINILISTLNTALVQKEIISLLPNTDPFQISSDIIRSLRRLISNAGILIKLPSGDYILCYKMKKGTTPAIILHQLNLAVSSFFNLSSDLSRIEKEVKTFPSTGIGAKSILEAFV